MSSLSGWISRRYLFSSEKKTLVSAITFVAVTGVAVGVAALIIVIGVMDGAEKDLYGKMIEIYPHAKIMNAYGLDIERPGDIIAMLESRPEVERAARVIQKESLFATQSGAETEVVGGKLVGLDRLSSRMIKSVEGKVDPKTLHLGESEVLLGKPMAEKLGVGPGDSITAITGILARSANRQGAEGKRLIVAGTFETGYYSFDSLTAFISSETARSVFGVGDACNYVQVRLKEPTQAAQFKRDLQATLPPSLKIVTWNEENGFFFQSLMIQKWGLFLILMLIVLVAGFNIIGTLILMVSNKTREIGILRAMGGPAGLIRGAFLNSGMIIGALGTSIGVALGLVICYLLGNVIQLEMPPSVYNFEHLPVLVKPMTVVVIVISAMSVCLLASLFPSIQASRLDPVEALRYE